MYMSPQNEAWDHVMGGIATKNLANDVRMKTLDGWGGGKPPNRNGQ
eukprot:CAMPEP_0172522636 /NCGR_PEP_ID=MMETSP1066-20121228/293237_1 /TAXON_ID=671091 /ORGANISM="Coscinodiscus wailesii, Strain CCMP2513" /LENGTH=45 /DNA_ID= /DNA_START= /DNA_END= /DNA_ORIENTATION=